MLRLYRRGMLILLFLAALTVLVGACALVSTPPPAPTPTPTLFLPTLALAPTATPLPSQCVSDPNTGGAGISPDIPLPADAIIFDLGHGGSGSVTATPVSFVKTGVCTKSLTPDAVRALFAAQMPANGWAHSATFPANGDLNAPCPDAYCWKKTPAPNFARTVALENVRVVGGITVYAVDEIRYG